jgi:hypothetical protein
MFDSFQIISSESFPIHEFPLVNTWYRDITKIYPRPNAELGELIFITSLFKIQDDSVFVEKNGNVLLFQVDEYNQAHLIKIPDDIRHKYLKNVDGKILPMHLCGGCAKLPYNGFKDKNMWCSFSRAIAVLQDI